MGAISRVATLALWCVTTFGQTFEAADVHVSPLARNPYTFASGGVLRGGRYDLRKATLLDLIRTAWSVDPDTIVGGPEWLELDRFDVSAKAPAETPPQTIRLMLRALLRDRFKLAVHEDTRPMPAFALTAGRNKPKLTESSGSGPAGCEFQPQQGPNGSVFYACRNITMDAFAQRLRQLAGDYLGAPVLNATGIEGAWDFDLKWNYRSQVLPTGTDRTTVFDAVEKQLGLRLEQQTAPGAALVVDSANQKPTPNPAGTEKVLPRRVLEFEVADLKPSRPDELPIARVSPGRLEMRAFFLKTLIANAFDMDWDHADDLIAGLPKWTGDQRFDITAKPPVDTFGPAGDPYTDDLRLMTRSLLVERFGIKFHYEDRPTAAYALVSAKPKMKKADATRRSSCKEARLLANDPRDANPRLNRLVTCQNVTMQQFASLLQGFAPGYLATPVEDATGIGGAWDFTLSFSGAQFLTSPAAGENASDPNGAISLPDAINKQLGLKLEKRRRPVPILVIDHMEEKPTEN
jgi:uncharacterized protein (TIGR03435 family)